MNLNSPITGMPQTGLTSPTYSLVSDTAPSLNGKQFAVVSVGGTQSGVQPNTVGKPFSISFFRPATLKTAMAGILSAAGLIPPAAAPLNVYTLITRKAVAVNGVGGVAIARVETRFHIPVNAPEQDPASIKAMISAHGGAITQDPDQWFESIESGTL